MLKYFLISLLLVGSDLAVAQRDLTPGKRRDAFGGRRDFNNYRPFGIQLSLGPTYTMTRNDQPLTRVPVTDGGQRYQYTRDPRGNFGFFLDLGMAHFPMKPPKRKYRLISYVDWGVGLQSYAGKQNLTIDYLTAGGDILNSESETAKWSNIYTYGRITLHKNIYIGKKWFIDNGLGVNVDYRLSSNSLDHSTPFRIAPEKYQTNLSAQLHYGLGVGYKFTRGFFMVPSLETPVLGMSEWKNGNPSVSWFSSSYWPLKLRVKFIWLFKEKRRPEDCNSGSEEDRKRNKEYMQNR